MDLRLGLLKRGDRVLDLGCSPGSWLKYAAGRVGRSGLVMGVDIVEPGIALPDNARYVQVDVADLSPGDVEPSAFDVVLSDMAPRTSGAALVDQERSWNLFERALILAFEVLAPGGRFAGKLFFSPRHTEAISMMKERFSTVRTLRPRATRRASREVFLAGLEFDPSTGSG